MPRKKLTQLYRHEILNLVRRGPLTRQSLHLQTGVRLPTVIECLASLQKAGMVHEIKEVGSTHRGRKSFHVGLQPLFRSAIGIDIMGAHAHGVRIAFNGNLLAEDSCSLRPNTPQALENLILKLSKASPIPLEGVAISFAGLITSSTLKVDASSVVDGITTFAPIANYCRRRGYSLVFHNPPSPLAKMEAMRFPGERIAMLELDDGIGVSLAYLEEGSSSPRVIEGEIGHLPIDGNEIPCVCGATGCLETLLSTRRLVTDVRDWLGKNPDCLLYFLAKKEITQVDYELIVKAVESGDEALIRFIRKRLALLERTFRQIILLYRPDRIVLTGKLTRLERLLEAIVANFHETPAAGPFPHLKSTPITWKTWDPLERVRAGALMLFEPYFSPENSAAPINHLAKQRPKP